jgi:hypothetical protein
MCYRYIFCVVSHVPPCCPDQPQNAIACWPSDFWPAVLAWQPSCTSLFINLNSPGYVTFWVVSAAGYLARSTVNCGPVGPARKQNVGLSG